MFDQHAPLPPPLPVDGIPNHSTVETRASYEVPPPVNPTVKPKKKRDTSRLRKAPGAPKRFKSSYILFFMAKQKEIKAEIGEGASVGEISKRSSEKWKNLSPEDRAIWDAKAEADKERYNLEKEKYTGPWQVPWIRTKKNPNAPKRPMSAFLFFSQDKRRVIKEANPGMRNTEISRVLGGMWKKALPEERAPHIEREAAEREKYKVRIAKWRVEEKERTRELEEEQKAKWMGKSVGDESDRSINGYGKSSPIPSQRASPLPVHHSRPSSPGPVPISSYYAQQSYGEYYPSQNYGAPPPQYSSYGPYTAQTQQLPPPPQAQNYYRNYPPMPPADYHPRHYQEFPPVPRSDSMEDPRHRNHTTSPAPAQYGNYYAPPGPSGYGVDHHPSLLGSNPNVDYCDDYPPQS